MEKYVDITMIDNAEEARLLKVILRERGIPHKILSAGDGMSMAARAPLGLGLVKAPEEYRKMILYILADLRSNAASRH